MEHVGLLIGCHIFIVVVTTSHVATHDGETRNTLSA